MRTYVSFILCALFSLAVRPAEVATNSPAISLTKEGAQIRIAFTGTLQSADSVTGSWTDITNAAK
jgi:hypothetical protein